MSTDQLLAAVLASDLAVEIEAEFMGRLRNGWDVPAATGHVLGRFQSALASPSEGPVLLIALAALHQREGKVQDVIRDAALDLIETGEGLNAYRPADGAQRKLVQQMLQQFAELLKQPT